MARNINKLPLPYPDEMDATIELPKNKLIALVVAISVVSAGVGAGVAIVSLGVSPVAPGAGTLTGSNVLTLESQELLYDGNNVTAVNASINNTDSSSHTADIHIALKNTTSGAVVAEETVTGISLPANTVTTTTITLSSPVAVDEFDKVEVTVEQTG